MSSTLEIACGHCTKRFRVRAEFAGKTTRCPGCSAKLIVGANNAPPPPKIDDEVPQRRSRPRPIEEERVEPADQEWQSVASAFRREQVALYFIVLQVICELFVWLLMMMVQGEIYGDGFVLLVVLLLGLGPSLGAGLMGMLARFAAMGAPPESGVKGSASASLFAGIVAFGCVVCVGITQFAMMGGRRHDGDFALFVAVAGAILAALTSFISFGVFTAQVGIVKRAPKVAAAMGRMAITGTIGVILLIVGTGFFATLQLFTKPQVYYGYGPYPTYSYGPRYEQYAAIVMGIVLPVMLIVLLVMYHQLLSAGRRAVLKR